VPDPGATAGATRFLREDGTWNVPEGGAWSQTTPTSTCQGGSGTLVSTLRSNVVGKSAAFNVVVNVTSVGTCSGALQVPMPFTSNSYATSACYSQAVGGYSGTGTLTPGGTTLFISRYDGGSLAATGANVICSGIVEAQ
jgi:hypothetical protein